MSTKSSLIILSPGFPRDEHDTTCLPAQQVFVRALNKNFPSLNVIVIAFHYPFFSKKYQWFKNDVISFNGGNKRMYRRIFLWWRVYKTLKKIKEENWITGILSFWCTECALVGNYFARNNKLKHIAWILGQDAKQENIYVKWIRPSSEELVALSDFLSDTFFKNHGVRPAHTIPNGVDTNVFSTSKTERAIDIMGAGSLIALKQYNVFLEIIIELKKIKPAIKVILCGSGPEEQKLKKIIDQYHLEDNILLRGNIPHNDVLKLMQETKIFLHPSIYEGFSTVCLEALYAGAHVISFTKAMHQPIEHWHITNNKQEMIKKAADLLTNTATKYKPVLPYSIDDNVKAIMKLYDYSE
jgi:glycosyltransferase involved in cell wall biosynthesis